jgi:PPM family protein phosphatase
MRGVSRPTADRWDTPLAYGVRMDVAYRTEVGHVRSRNEDALLARPERGVLAVADGLGGHPAGDVASLTALASIDEAALSAGSSEDDLRAVAAAAHQAVLDAAAAEPGRTGMGTTLVLATVSADAALVLHVGDSRAYQLTANGGLSAVTQDHGMHGYLTQALGLDRDVAPDVARVECPPGSRLLLCTDGLTNMVEDSGVAELLGRGSAQDACDALVEAALEAGGVDNVTVVVAAF